MGLNPRLNLLWDFVTLLNLLEPQLHHQSVMGDTNSFCLPWIKWNDAACIVPSPFSASVRPISQSDEGSGFGDLVFKQRNQG